MRILGVILKDFPGDMPPDPLECSSLRHFP